jgi:phytoene/squalene synthetase
MSDAYLAPAASHRYVLDLVRNADRDRFLGALFAPEPARTDLLALLAFNHELARTRSVTREPMLARIRLEWWREAVAEAASAGKPRALRREVDPAVLPILLPALSLGDIGAWRKPLAYWWAARRGRY